MRFAGLLVVLGLMLSSCGSGADVADTPPSVEKSAVVSKTATPTPSPGAKAAADIGIPAPADLSEFQCTADAKGAWNASGILQNDGKKSATYQVTVLVGHADGKDASALTKEFPSIAAGGSIKVVLAKIPAAKDAAQCYVQVLRK
jgi:hypothetical protein